MAVLIYIANMKYNKINLKLLNFASLCDKIKFGFLLH